MKSTLFSNLLQITPEKDKSYQQRYPSNFNKSTRGFTLIEVLVTIVIVGILSAIAAPSWLGFVARQRLNKANDSVLAAVQDAQRQAKKTKRNYSVSIQLNSNIPQISVHPGLTPPAATSSSWRNIGADLEIKPGTILLFTNLDGNDDATDDEIDYTDSSALDSPKTITFDHKGGLELPVNISDEGLIIALATPKPSNNNQASDVKRCVIVQTLIGGIRTGINEDCD
ncbi:MAG: type II secretion system protein [Rivularia sp. (in: cyanobacteria)]|jgi:prepilin-type N-terminal cleavage/methylation domain-containing protein